MIFDKFSSYYNNITEVQRIMTIRDEKVYINIMNNNTSSLTSCIIYDKVDYGVFFYFLGGSLTLIACIIGYSYVIKYQDLYQQKDDNEQQTELQCNNNSNRDDYETIRSQDAIDNFENDGTINTTTINTEITAITNSTNNNVNFYTTENDGIFRTLTSSEINDNDTTTLSTTHTVWKYVNQPLICIYLTFLITLSLFPGLTSQLHSTNQCIYKLRIYNDLYIPFTFILFNLGDLFGRILSSYQIIQKYIISSKLIYYSLLRILFIPLLFLCIGSTTNTSYINTIQYQISSDIYSMLIQFLFATTNGLLLSLSFIYAPNLLPKQHEQQTAAESSNSTTTTNNIAIQERMSEMLNFAVAFGLLSGSLFSYPVLKITSG